MSLFFRDFDSEKKAFVNPDDTVQRKDGFPSIAVSTFSGDIIDDHVKACNPPEIARLYTANGSLPVYQAEYKGEKIALFVSRVGAPACAAGLEEIIAMGAQKIVLFGCCGVLNENATKGKIILPTSAVRDEGTSQYYFPHSDEIEADKHCIKIAADCFFRIQHPLCLRESLDERRHLQRNAEADRKKKRARLFGCGNGMRRLDCGRPIQKYTVCAVPVRSR